MKALIFDTETSGLFDYRKRADEPGQPRMASLAAMLVNGQDELQSMYRLIKPDGWEQNFIDDAKAGTGAFSVNGLTWDRLNDEGVPVVQALEEYDALFTESEGFAAYNISFDSKVVRAEQRRASRPDRYGERPTFCIMRAATDLCKMPPTEKMMAAGKKWSKNPKLAEAVQILLGRELVGAHDAKVDLQATHELYTLMLGMARVVEFKPQVSKLQDNEA